MLINSFETTIGKPLKVSERVEGTIKTLALMDSLTPTNKENVYVITHSNGASIPKFGFPITLQDHKRQMITVYDDRPFRNKNDTHTINAAESTMNQLCAYLQQDIIDNNFGPLLNVRNFATKTFVGAYGHLISARATLSIQEGVILRVILGYYFVCLTQNNRSEIDTVTLNILGNTLRMDRFFVQTILNDLEPMDNLIDLHKAITNHPALFKLKGLSLKDMMAIISQLSYSSVSKAIVMAAVESPCLFIAMMYCCINNRMYQKTNLGVQLDPKHNKEELTTFTRSIDYTYNLKSPVGLTGAPGIRGF
jgi:hypothetical protein